MTLCASLKISPTFVDYFPGLDDAEKNHEPISDFLITIRISLYYCDPRLLG